MDLNDNENAIRYIREAIQEHPLETFYTALATLLPNSDPQSQIETYNRALALNESAVLPFCLRAERYAAAAMYDELARDTPRLRELQQRSIGDQRALGVPCLQPFHASYMPLSAALQRLTAELYASRELVANTSPPPRRVPSSSHRLHIGYVSSDLYNHPMGRYIQDLIASHNRSQFKVSCVALATHDDDTSRRIRSHCEHWLDLSNVSDHHRAAQLLRDAQIDIAVDLNGWTKGT